MRKCISKWIHNYQDIHKYATAMFDYQRLRGTSFVHWSSTVTYPCWWFDGDYTPQHIGEWFDLDLVKLCFFTGWWFQTFFIFHNIWDVILPIDFHIFQDGYCTTNQFISPVANPWLDESIGHMCYLFGVIVTDNPSWESGNLSENIQ